jgi:Uma2 family endonuclease
MVIVEDELKKIIFPKSDLLSDESPMETELHLRQLMLLIQSLELLWKDRQDFYAFGNLTIYYSPNQRQSKRRFKSEVHHLKSLTEESSSVKVGY